MAFGPEEWLRRSGRAAIALHSARRDGTLYAAASLYDGAARTHRSDVQIELIDVLWRNSLSVVQPFLQLVPAFGWAPLNGTVKC